MDRKVTNTTLTLDGPPRNVPGSVRGLGQSSQSAAFCLDLDHVDVVLNRLTRCYTLLVNEPIPAVSKNDSRVWPLIGTVVSQLLYESGWSVRRDFQLGVPRCLWKKPRSHLLANRHVGATQLCTHESC